MQTANTQVNTAILCDIANFLILVEPLDQLTDDVNFCAHCGNASNASPCPDCQNAA